MASFNGMIKMYKKEERKSYSDSNKSITNLERGKGGAEPLNFIPKIGEHALKAICLRVYFGDSCAE